MLSLTKNKHNNSRDMEISYETNSVDSKQKKYQPTFNSIRHANNRE